MPLQDHAGRSLALATRVGAVRGAQIAWGFRMHPHVYGGTARAATVSADRRRPRTSETSRRSEWPGRSVGCRGAVMTRQTPSDRDDERLRELFLDSACPYGVVIGEPLEPVLVADMLSFAESRLGARPCLEAELDACVRAMGGRRETMADPWTAPLRLLNRLRGRHNTAASIWLLPSAAIRAGRERAP
jgi:hypothetical protein